MANYRGPLNVFDDGDGSVIPITLNPGDVTADGLIIDVSGLQTAAGNQFGYIGGLTVDATGANVASGIVSMYFSGTGNITRQANGGNTQVYKIAGPCRSITIKNLAWTSGSIIFVLWNSQPANELQSPLNVIATGSVSISGTPTVNVGNSPVVSISGTPNVNISNVPAVTVSGTPTVNVGNSPAVSITGTPTVNLGAGNNVGITGTPTVNLGAGNNVGITGTPTVNLGAGNNVGITGTPNVNITTGSVSVTNNVSMFAAPFNVASPNAANLGVLGNTTLLAVAGAGHFYTVIGFEVDIYAMPTNAGNQQLNWSINESGGTVLFRSHYFQWGGAAAVGFQKLVSIRDIAIQCSVNGAIVFTIEAGSNMSGGVAAINLYYRFT